MRGGTAAFGLGIGLLASVAASAGEAVRLGDDALDRITMGSAQPWPEVHSSSGHGNGWTTYGVAESGVTPEASAVDRTTPRIAATAVPPAMTVGSDPARAAGPAGAPTPMPSIATLSPGVIGRDSVGSSAIATAAPPQLHGSATGLLTSRTLTAIDPGRSASAFAMSGGTFAGSGLIVSSGTTAFASIP